MAHPPEPQMWETYTWKSLASRLLHELAEQTGSREFSIAVDPSLPQPGVTLTTDSRIATLELDGT